MPMKNHVDDALITQQKDVLLCYNDLEVAAVTRCIKLPSLARPSGACVKLVDF